MATQAAAPEVPKHVLDYLGEQKTLTLATASPAGVPRATTLTYVNEGATLWVWMRPDTVTASHIEQNPQVGFAIDDIPADLSEAKGVQGAGDCHVVLNPGELTRASELFGKKFPSLAGALTTGISFFRLSPTELQFIDNSAAGDSEGATEFHRELVFSIFRELPRQEAETVAGKLQTVQVDAGEVVVRQGAPAEKFFIIVDGEAEVLREDDGDSRRIATLVRGQFFGEIGILRDTPRMATVRALAPMTLFAMERDVFRSLIAQSMGTTQDFDRIIRQRLTELEGPPAG